MIDIDRLEALAKAANSGLPSDSIQFAMAAMDRDTILALIAEVRALRAYREMARNQVYELMGVEADVEQGNGFDAVCLGTIKRVMAELSENAARAKEQA